MALTGVPVLSGRFSLEIGDYDSISIQEVTMPEISVEYSTYSDDGREYKNPAKTKIGELVLKKVKDTGSRSDNWAWDWLNSVVNFGGAANVPSVIKKNGRLVVYDTAGVPVEMYGFEGAFPSKLNPGTLNKDSADNLIEEVTLTLDWFYQIPLL